MSLVLNSTCTFVESPAEKMFKIFVYFVILLGSLFGNIFIIIIFYKHRDLHKTVNYFIVNMAVSDLVFPLLLLPVEITAMVTADGSWRWYVSGVLGSITCKFITFATKVTILVSTQSLVWIAIDRFVAVVFPIRLGLISSKTRITAIASTWILAATFNFPFLMAAKLRVQRNNTFCETDVKMKSFFPSNEAFMAYLWLQLTFYSFAPVSLLTILYASIAVALKAQSKALANLGTNMQQNYFKKRKRAIRLSFVTMVCICICVSPMISLRLFHANYWQPRCAFLRVLTPLAGIFIYSEAIVNPVICLSFVESYRRGLRNILCSSCRNQNNVMAKREKLTLKEMKTLSGENYRRTSKETRKCEETLDTVL